MLFATENFALVAFLSIIRLRKMNKLNKAISENRRARFDYEILEKFEAGVELSGQEVKSAKNGNFNLSGGYGIIRRNEAWLINSQIPPYQPKNVSANYDPARPRRLLLHKEEIKKLEGKLSEKSFALIPLRAYIKNNLVKVELGLGQKRKKVDKRELIKKRAVYREIKQSRLT